MTNFLLELGTEEIPAGYIQPALAQGKSFLENHLKERQLPFENIETYSTPRRLVFYVTGLPDKQPDVNKELSGPPCSVAYDKENKPTPAYFGFLKKNSLKETDVQTKDTPKGKVIYAAIVVKGEKTEKLLSESVPELVKNLPFPKSMWWQTKVLTFARPLRYIMALLGNKTLKINLFGIDCGNKTYGHLFFHNKPIIIKTADLKKYQAALKKARVLVDHNERKQAIADEITRIVGNSAVCNEPELLEEVTNLVEYPVAIECEFDESFLKLPDAVIESAMKSHQRYFPLRSAVSERSAPNEASGRSNGGKLLSKFIVISNNPEAKKSIGIKEGNERVIKARLSDASFFWEQDRKIPLEKYAEKLDSIAFLGKLGTMNEKSARLKELALFISQDWCDDKDKETVTRAAELCKADLLTGMVGEFPDLQGIMGYEYLKDSDPDVALAIKEHYQPRFAGDKLPKTKAGICLSLAEKFDNLVSLFSIGEKPTGSSDAYGLRRQMLGIIKIILTRKLNLSLNRVWDKALESLIGSVRPFADDIAKIPNLWSQEFWKEVAHTHQILDNHRKQIKIDLNKFTEVRLFQMLDEEEHINQNLFNAVLFTTDGLDKLYLFKSRLNAIQKLSKDSLWNELIEVVERTYNISKSMHTITPDIDKSLLKEEAEIELHRLYEENKDAIQKLIAEEKYEEASRLYHKTFAKPAHTFFEKVFVNVPEADIKTNRLALLKKINQLYSSGIADLSRIPRK